MNDAFFENCVVNIRQAGLNGAASAGFKGGARISACANKVWILLSVKKL
jgi:hypothetical protein